MQSNSADDCIDVYLNHNIEILNLFNPELQLINTKPIIKNKLKHLLGQLKEFKIQKVLVLENKNLDHYKSMNKIFHLRAKLIVNDSHIGKTFGLMHQRVMTKIKKSVSKDWIVKTIENMIFRSLRVRWK